MMAAGVLIGPAAIYASARGIAQGRKHGDEGGLAGAILSLILGILVTGAGIFFVFTTAGAFRPPAIRKQ
jgi:threonine/homoserine/homoserine lactone efflux protein